MPRNMNRIISTGLLAAGIATGCDVGGQPSAETTTPTATAVAIGSSTLRFNDLGGGSSIILVYPGTGEAPADKVANGSYKDNEEVPVICLTNGRQINSNPRMGEVERSSNQWVEIAGSPGQTQYASLAYGDLSGPPPPPC